MAEEALQAAEELGDDFSLAQAWNLLGRIRGSVRGELAQAETAWRQALTHAERGGFAAEKAESIGWLLISTIFGPLPAEQGIARCVEFLELAEDDSTIRAWCCVERSVLEAMRGDFALARELFAEGAQTLDEVGLKVWAANTAQEAFMIENIAGTPEAATDVLRRSYEIFEEMGERGFRSTIAGFLAQALYAQGEYAASARYSRTCEEAAAPDDALSQLLWRRSRAKLMAREGNLERAEALAREAVEVAVKTDFLTDQADGLVDLAEILALAGRREEARRELEEAARLYERKGNLPSLERARRVAEDLD
jgi:tetratricopeptide (TPR) repeat protein